MQDKVKHVEIHEVQDIDKETEILQQLSKYRGSLITQANEDSILFLRKEFIEWLKIKNLDYILKTIKFV